MHMTYGSSARIGGDMSVTHSKCEFRLTISSRLYNRH